MQSGPLLTRYLTLPDLMVEQLKFLFFFPPVSGIGFDPSFLLQSGQLQLEYLVQILISRQNLLGTGGRFPLIPSLFRVTIYGLITGNSFK